MSSDADHEAAELRAYLAERDVPCPGCGYNLRGVRETVCPECGDLISLDNFRAQDLYRVSSDVDELWVSWRLLCIGIFVAGVVGAGLIYTGTGTHYVAEMLWVLATAILGGAIPLLMIKALIRLSLVGKAVIALMPFVVVSASFALFTVFHGRVF
ncbi:MAG: hypothetical protein AAGF47_12970 [Planctomycetota bacterium]